MNGLALVPLLVLALLVAALRTGRSEGGASLREELLGAASMLGAITVVSTELLGALRAIAPGTIAGFWLSCSAAAAIALLWRWRRLGPPPPVRAAPLDATDGVLVGSIALIALTLFVVAWLSPPQSSDSIGYHMARVMHWIQNRSIAHYPTNDAPQLFEPPLAEIVRLHLQLLSGGDRAGSLLQWFAMMGSLAAASLVARDLGGSRRAQIFAALFAATLPIGIAQASSGKNGWVEAFWLLALAHAGASLLGRQRSTLSRAGVLSFGAALGLELTTKISAWLFAPPFVLLAAAGFFRAPASDRRRVMPLLAVGVLVAGAIATPYLARNLSLYGHPLVDPVFREKSGLAYVTPAVVASNLVRNVAFQFGTPSTAVNAALARVVGEFHDWIGLRPSDPATTQFGPFRIRPPTRVEEELFSPLHILLALGAGAALVVSRRARSNGARLPYLAALAAALVGYSAAVQWQPASCRLLMPLLVLAAPLVATVLSEIRRGRYVPFVAAVLLLACIPYTRGVHARPLSLEPGRGILVTPRDDLYFARVPTLRETYRDVAREVLASGVRNVGVVFGDDGEPEYLFWMLLKRADPAVRIENVMVTGASASLAERPPFRGFRPELVVVFASDAKTLRFRSRIDADGMAMDLVRKHGLAALYRVR